MPEPWTASRCTALRQQRTPDQPECQGGAGALFMPVGGDAKNPESEDCLFLNVWTPGLNDAGKRPVMVWLHGGGFLSGSGSDKMIAGKNPRRGTAGGDAEPSPECVRPSVTSVTSAALNTHCPVIAGMRRTSSRHFEVDPRQCGSVRRRSLARDDLRRVRRRAEGLNAHGVPAGQGPVPSRRIESGLRHQDARAG